MPNTKKYICVHGHFYQPPRENPWLEIIERQPSAAPFHDWNERVHAECYAPNAVSRLLDGAGKIVRMQNNYAHISFNFGPTLIGWMREADRRSYDRIVEADRVSARRLGGHGNAMAQVYNHIIMPLASWRDKLTQVRWGIADFEFHFGRKPEGMWLAETAADTESLEALAHEGIRFTVLSPFQARAFKPIEPGVKFDPNDDTGWIDCDHGRVDPKRPYRMTLPSGRSIILFFYDGPISQAVAFEDILLDGNRFANRLKSGLQTDAAWNQLMHIATDGESYGHHWRFGEMALARALERLNNDADVELVNYGAFLDVEGPFAEVKLNEPSAWSCSHGVGRWERDCGCNTGGGPPMWNQKWRVGLRDSMDWLRDELDALFEQEATALWDDPWAARDGYIDMILHRDKQAFARFWEAHPLKASALADDIDDEAQRRQAMTLLETQRQRLLIYTSCAWFFDELTGIEPMQNLKYAARAIQLALDLSADMESGFKQVLATATSNNEEEGTGAEIWARHVRPEIVPLSRMAAHFVMRVAPGHLADTPSGEAHVTLRQYGHEAELIDIACDTEGEVRLAHGRIRIRSMITRQAVDSAFAVFRRSDEQLRCMIRVAGAGERPALFEAEALKQFRAHPSEPFGDPIGGAEYFTSEQDLFSDALHEFIEEISTRALRELSSYFEENYERFLPFMDRLREIGHALPSEFKLTARVALEQRIERALADDSDGLDIAEAALREMRRHDLEIPEKSLGRMLAQRLESLFDRIERQEPQTELRRLRDTIAWAERNKVKLDFAPTQHRLNDLIRRESRAMGQWTGPTSRGNNGLSEILREIGLKYGFSEKALQFERPVSSGVPTRISAASP